MSACFSPTAQAALEQLVPDVAAREASCQRIEAIEVAILDAAATMNLTSDRDPALFRARHTEDALLSAAVVGPMWSGSTGLRSVIDVGSGAGLPGLIWAALWPNAQVTLLESRSRRAEFIGRVAREIGLSNVESVCARAEELARDPAHREHYDLVTARAVAAMPALCELTLPFARIGGGLAAIKSAEISDELDSARPAIDKLGGDFKAIELRPYTRDDGKACIVCWVPKTSKTPGTYPRLPGVPAKNPILS